MARFDRGWVKIHRKAILGDIYSNFTRGGLFTVLVGIANMQGSSVSWKGKPRKLERGEIVTSITELSELGETDRRTVDRHLNYLVLRGTIAVEKCASGTFIKILNFDKYQEHDAEQVKPQRNDTLNDMPNDMYNDSAHIEERKNTRRKEGKNISDSLIEELQSIFKFQGLGAGVNKRLTELASNEQDFADLKTALTHYKAMLALPENDWRKPKTTLATFLGTKDKPFWRDFVDPSSCLPTRKQRGAKAASGALQREQNADLEFQAIFEEAMGDAHGN